MKRLLWYILFSFSKRSVFTFIIIKPKTKLCLSFFKGPILNFKYFSTCFCCKSVSCNYMITHLTFPHGSEPPALSIFDDAALARQPLRLLPFGTPLSEPREKLFYAFYLVLAKFEVLQYASDILKCWIVRDVKSKFTLKSSGIPSFKKAIPRFTSCFEYLGFNYPFTIASFHQPFL